MRTDVEKARRELWDMLNLNNRTIIFHVLDMGCLSITIGRGMVETPDDLYDADEFIDAELDNPDKQEFFVYSCGSYALGNGEAVDADEDDVVVLSNLSVHTLEYILELYADLLCSFKDVAVENADYEEDEEE